MKLVSVIVMSYRSANTIVQTLDSIKKQTYKNIELIITDDCSPDDTVEVAEKWIKENQGVLTDIKLVTTEKNTGIPGNLNRALRQAKGEYMKAIAADDYMMEDAIEEYVAFCEQNPGTFPVAKVKLFSEEEADFRDVQAYCDRCYEFARMDYKEQYHLLLIQNRIIAPSAAFYPVELIQRLGGYDEYYRWFEDYPIHLKIMRAGYRCGLIDKELIGYRMSAQSITASQQLRLKKTEMKLFFRQKLWYMFEAGMGWEAIKQSRYWLKIALQK